MMSGLASRIGEGRGRSIQATGALGFAAKVIGIGFCAGLALICCQFLIDTFFRTIR